MAAPLKVFKALEVLFDKCEKDVDALAAYYTLKQELLSRENEKEIRTPIPLILRNIDKYGNYVYDKRKVEMEA